MFVDEEIAREVHNSLFEIQRKLNASLLNVEHRCSNEEFRNYRLAVGKIMGEMILEVLNPIYQRHPNIMPAELR